MTMMRLKITSKGTNASTAVIDMDSGAMLPCRSVEWSFGPDDLKHTLTATLVVHIAAVEIEQDGEMVLEPLLLART
jgi:hypothetical protein